jgi:hypothetical protein
MAGLVLARIVDSVTAHLLIGIITGMGIEMNSPPHLFSVEDTWNIRGLEHEGK